MNERRVTDEERERTVKLLQEHTVMGRLTPEELEERSRAALAAQSAGDLTAVTRDLPTLPEPPVSARIADRVPLRAHVAAYVVVNAVLIVLWLVTRERDPGTEDRGSGQYWPLWVLVFWAFLLAGHALLSMRKPAVRRAERRRDLAG